MEEPFTKVVFSFRGNSTDRRSILFAGLLRRVLDELACNLKCTREETREGCCPRCRILKSSGVLGLSLLKYVFRDVSKCRLWLHLQVKQILDCLPLR